jgi:hypothetical protein
LWGVFVGGEESAEGERRSRLAYVFESLEVRSPLEYCLGLSGGESQRFSFSSKSTMKLSSRFALGVVVVLDVVLCHIRRLLP